jgi:predicted phage terminase large subunit-like protein
VRVTADKFTRAEAGKVVLVRGPWIDDFLDQVCSFPNGRHDDQVDAVSLAVQMVETRKHQAWGFSGDA